MTIWTPTHHNSMYSKLQAALEEGQVADSEINMDLESDSELERSIKIKQRERRPDPWVIPLVSSDVQAEGDPKKREIKQAEKMSSF